jgi:hypothetical protein
VDILQAIWAHLFFVVHLELWALAQRRMQGSLQVLGRMAVNWPIVFQVSFVGPVLHSCGRSWPHDLEREMEIL